MRQLRDFKNHFSAGSAYAAINISLPISLRQDRYHAKTHAVTNISPNPA
jgi:hypothetical protein